MIKVARQESISKNKRMKYFSLQICLLTMRKLVRLSLLLTIVFSLSCTNRNVINKQAKNGGDDSSDPFLNNVSESLEYHRHTVLDSFYQKHSNNIIEFESTELDNVVIYRDAKTRDIRVGFEMDDTMITWKLLGEEEAGRFSCDAYRVDFDLKGSPELVVQYKSRTVYSSYGSSHQGVTEIWDIDKLRSYIAITHLDEENGFGTNGDGSLFLCKKEITIAPLRIAVKTIQVENEEGSDGMSEHCEENQLVHYCLNENTVEECILE